MATCSLFDTIVINDPKFVDFYIEGMEAYEKAPFKPRTEDQKSGCITDPEEIRRVIELCLANKGD
ncbi:MAG: hypothetical protein J6E46_10610 [Faecalicoccus sp.]|nr:hypothetical protein [Faecalicoccus sp.]